VLIDPPAIADGRQKGTQQAKDVSLSRGLKHLSMTGVMPHKCHLGKHEGKKRGIQKLHPEEVHGNQDAKCQNKEAQDLEDFAGVIDWLRVEQPLLRQESLQLGILMTVCVSMHSGKAS
jgi:hypothetical protein